MDSTQQSNLPKKAAKSIFQSKTFWGATLTAVAAIAPIIGEAVEAKKIHGQRHSKSCRTSGYNWSNSSWSSSGRKRSLHS